MNFFTNIVKKYIKNDPCDMMNTTMNETDTLCKESPDFGLKTNEDTNTPGRENSFDTKYESPGDVFYNTVDVIASKNTTIDKDIDLINLDQSVRLSVGYINGHSGIGTENFFDSPKQLNETFNPGEIRVINKHLKVKTADLLSVSGIGGRFSISNEDEDVCAADGVSDEKRDSISESSSVNTKKIGELFPASSTETLNEINVNENINIEKADISNENNILEADEELIDINIKETLIVETDDLSFETISDNSLEHSEKDKKSIDANINETGNLTFETVSDKSLINPEKNNTKEEKDQTLIEANINETGNLTFETVSEKSLINPEKNNTKEEKDQTLIEANINETGNLTFETVSEKSLINPEKNNTKEEKDQTLIEANINEILIVETDNLSFETIAENSLENSEKDKKSIEANINETGNLTFETVSEKSLINPEKNNTKEEQDQALIENIIVKIDNLTLESVPEKSDNSDFESISGKSLDIGTVNNKSEQGDITITSLEFESSPRQPHSNFKMTDMVEKLNQQQAEISDLKLKLNAAQQHNASLELQIHQNEEIVIKAQAETLRTEQNYQQEVKQLKEKLNENSKIIEKDRILELEEQIKDSKAREAKLLTVISQHTKEEANFQKLLDQYDINFKSRQSEFKKIQEERIHFTNLELAFSDVHSKYEKTKAIVLGLRTNEESLVRELELAQSTNVQHEERYESLKAHARTQIEKSNKEIHATKELHEVEVNKLKALIRRLEIKVSSLELSLQQKTEECEQLSALCDEVTGKKV